MVNNWLNFNLSSFFPNYCTLCGGKVPDSATALCKPCQEQLPWLTEACRYCSHPLTYFPHQSAATDQAQHTSEQNPACEPVNQEQANAICGRCQKSPPPYHSTHCLFRYKHPVDKLITQFKYNQQLAHGQLLGQLLAQSLLAHIPAQAMPEAIIPMPLHPRRLRQRGFNQAYEIAHFCARQLQLPLLHTSCQRIKDTPPQLTLDAKTRRRNLRRAFTAKPMPGYRSVAIVDDVITTGSTVSELSRELLKVGLERIDLWCIARTTIE